MTTTANIPFRFINGVKWAYLHRGAGRNLLVREKDYQLFENITKKAAKNYRQHYLKTQIMGLSANNNSPANLISRFTVLKRKLSLMGMDVHYEMRGGDILITQLVITPEQPVNNTPGLRQVKYTEQNWKAEKKALDKIPSSQPGKPIHVGINGLAKSANDAADYMPDFINYGYPQDALKETENESYTLFYNPQQGFFNADWQCIQDSTGIRGGTRSARLLASAIRLAAREKLPINWTVHERGAAIFKQALRLLAKQGVSGLSDQQVFYANPVINMELVDKLRRQVGMRLSEKGHVMNELSLHQGAVAGNWISSSAMLWQNGDKGNAIARPVLTVATVAGLASTPGAVGAAAYGLSGMAFLGANLFASKTNRGVINSPGDALNHYFFNRKTG